MFDPRTHHEDDMPMVDAEGRKIIRVACDNEQGWRYDHEDNLILTGEKEYKGKVKPKLTVVAETGDEGGTKPEGWGE